CRARVLAVAHRLRRQGTARVTAVPAVGAAPVGPLAPARVPVADYLSGVLRRLRPLPPLDLEITQAYGNVLAEDVRSPGPVPAFDHAAVDGYAARFDDIA